MLAVTKRTTDTNVYITKFVEFNKESVREAEQSFIEFRQEKVILNNHFTDQIWIVSNEAITVEFDFNFSETLFHQQVNRENRDLGEFEDFINALKVYIIYSLNNTSILAIQRFISLLKSVIKNTKFFNPDNSDNLVESAKFNRPHYILMFIEFTNFIPFNDIDEFQEQCQVVYDILSEELNTKKRGKKQQRQLAEFQSFFHFDKLLNQFWNYMATNEDKLMYYPVYLWWKITNVLPLRPTELIVTPSDCLQINENGESVLKIRRTNLKGHYKGKSKGIVKHKLDTDYTLYEYPVSKEVSDAILDYKRRVEEYGESKFLFSKKAYYETLGIYKNVAEDRTLNSEFTLKNFRRILARFYKKIFHEKFGMNLYYKRHHALGEDKIVFEDEDTFLKPNEIMMINVGDTRHFSMVNIVLNDFNPILIKDFAGHEDINQSYHYFDHIDKIVKCMTHYKFNKLRKGIVMDTGSQSFNESFNLESIFKGLENKYESFKEIDNGRCYSKKFLVGDLDDCIPSFGDCPNCEFSQMDKTKYTHVIELRKKELENRLSEEGLLLLNLLRNYNETYDEYAEFQRTILRIQQATNEYMNISNKLF